MDMDTYVDTITDTNTEAVLHTSNQKGEKPLGDRRSQDGADF